MKGEKNRSWMRFLSLMMMGSLLFFACSKNKPQEESDSAERIEETPIDIPKKSTSGMTDSRKLNLGNTEVLKQVFNDTNDLQLTAARQLGIKPITDIPSAYFTNRPIIKVSNNPNYHIDNLTHSMPYLVPEAAALLNDIGSAFIDTLKRRGIDNYRIDVTSLLRTPQSVRSLQKVNVNATENSTHQYGTTFDISYYNFKNDNPANMIDEGRLKVALAEVLNDLRNQGRCYVKFEVKTACFHITARN